MLLLLCLILLLMLCLMLLLLLFLILLPLLLILLLLFLMLLLLFTNTFLFCCSSHCFASHGCPCSVLSHFAVPHTDFPLGSASHRYLCAASCLSCCCASAGRDLVTR